MFYIDPYFSKSTSGARFFDSIKENLKKFPEYSQKNYEVVLVNISSPLSRFILYKLLNKKIIIRVDGNYSYPITKGSIRASNLIIFFIFKILRILKKINPIKIFLKKFAKEDKVLYLFNLQFNFVNYLKIYFSNLVIYQSTFSKDSHKDIFPNKKFFIVNNSSTWQSDNLPLNKNSKERDPTCIRICTSFHKERPLKGFGDLLNDLENFKKTNTKFSISLFIYGYEPNCFVKTYSKYTFNIDKFLNRNRDWIETYPTFIEYSQDLSNKLVSSDIYVTYAQLDPCPNFVLEAISHGLPIIGCNSGGVPEIVGNCGEILNLKTYKSKYQNLNFEYGLMPPSSEDLFINLIKIKKNLRFYKENISIALKNRLSKENTIYKYHTILKNLS